jgi:hypothetical protein
MEASVKKTILGLTLFGLCLSPAFAQTKTPVGELDARAECQANFKAADKDGNGTLTRSEIESSEKAVPTALATENSVTMARFMSHCNAIVPKGG